MGVAKGGGLLRDEGKAARLKEISGSPKGSAASEMSALFIYYRVGAVGVLGR